MNAYWIATLLLSSQIGLDIELDIWSNNAKAKGSSKKRLASVTIKIKDVR